MIVHYLNRRDADPPNSRLTLAHHTPLPGVPGRGLVAASAPLRRASRRDRYRSVTLDTPAGSVTSGKGSDRLLARKCNDLALSSYACRILPADARLALSLDLTGKQIAWWCAASVRI